MVLKIVLGGNEILEKEIFLKIYTKDNNNILVLEGKGEMNEDCYFPHGSIIGSGVTGKEHISITEDAKQLFKRIIMESKKTGDDLTCLDIYKLKNGRIHISWLGKRKEEIDIRKLENFWIGTGESFPQVSLLDELSE